MEEKIRRLVTYYIKYYGTRDPSRIAQHLSIPVFYYPLGNVAGQYKYLEHTKCIVINSDIMDENFLRIVMAHELGHALLHWKENCCFMAHKTLLSTSRIERQANKFAAELLIEDSILFEYAGSTIQQISAIENVNEELIKLKFNL